MIGIKHAVCCELSRADKSAYNCPEEVWAEWVQEASGLVFVIAHKGPSDRQATCPDHNPARHWVDRRT